MPTRRVLLVASYGGHWVQLRRLAEAFDGLDLHYVTTTAAVAAEIVPAPLTVVPDANLHNPLGLARLALRMGWLVWRARPDYVVSTGAAPGFFALAFGKLCGARTIWIDSIANAESLSLSGRWVAGVADLWLTQWPHLARPDGPAYRGALL